METRLFGCLTGLLLVACAAAAQELAAPLPDALALSPEVEAVPPPAPNVSNLMEEMPWPVNPYPAFSAPAPAPPPAPVEPSAQAITPVSSPGAAPPGNFPD